MGAARVEVDEATTISQVLRTRRSDSQMDSLYRPGAQLNDRGAVGIRNLGWEATTIQDETQEAEMKRKENAGSTLS